MIRISITAAAFEAIAATMPLGSVGYEAKAKGERLIWLDAAMVWERVAREASDVVRFIAQGQVRKARPMCAAQSDARRAARLHVRSARSHLGECDCRCGGRGSHL
jgi:hypothetical protein